MGKHATEDFRVNYDVDGISRATITVRAMAKGIRHSIRKVAQAYLR
ncbi:MAG: FMN-binding protein [Gammaproteobacteria bacterium]|nr:FMN-binding protein [Gammaproteobacteria bacterium]